MTRTLQKPRIVRNNNGSLLRDEKAVQLAIHLSERIDENNIGHSEIAQTLAFVRVLMAMYEAENVEEAKAIFSSVLVDETSRENRHNRFTVDVAAIVSGRGGGQWTSKKSDSSIDGETDTEDKIDKSVLYGLYAPFGVQIADELFGFLI